MKKKGISPVIASVLLISLAIILAVIIFLWARSFGSEQAVKNGENVELACQNVEFNAEFQGDKLVVLNEGSVSIWAVDIKKSSLLGDVSEIAEEEVKIDSGESAQVSLSGVSSGDKLIIIPELLGETEDKSVVYSCGDDYAIELEV